MTRKEIYEKQGRFEDDICRLVKEKEDGIEAFMDQQTLELVVRKPGEEDDILSVDLGTVSLLYEAQEVADRIYRIIHVNDPVEPNAGGSKLIDFIKTKQERAVLKEALSIVKESTIFPFVDRIIVYGTLVTPEWVGQSVNLFFAVNNKAPDVKEKENALRDSLICLPESDMMVNCTFVSKKDYETKKDYFLNLIRRDGVTVYDETGWKARAEEQ